MKKKYTLFLTIMVVIYAFSINVIAATDDETYAGKQLNILGILKGYEDGSLKLDNSITRAEVATLTVRILGYEDSIVVGNQNNFSDVDKTYWAYNNIQNAYKIGLIKGYKSGEFKPKNNITYAEVITIMVNALGKGGNLEGEWPNNYINQAKTLGIIPADSSVKPNKTVTRGEMAVIVWNTLLVEY